MGGPVLDLVATWNGTAVVVRARSGTRVVEDETVVGAAALERLQDLASRVAAKRVPWTEQLAFGQDLGQLLFPGRVGELLVDAVALLDPHDQVLVRITGGADPTAALPWELVHVPALARRSSLGPYLVLDRRVTLIRSLPAGTPLSTARARPLQRLVIAPATGLHGSSVLDGGEAELIAGALEGKVRCLTLDDPATRPAIHAALVAGTDIFHFVGHSHSSVGLQVAASDRRGTEHVGFRELSSWLRISGATLVVLNSCESGLVASDGGGGPAELLNSGAIAVVAMQHPIEDSHAVTFARAFYEALARGESLGLAMYRARQAMCLLGLSSEWAVPVLYLAEVDGAVPAGLVSSLPAAGPTGGDHRVRFRLPLVDDRFTGRTAELAALGAAAPEVAEGVRVHFISGLGGTGKTQLAAAYIARRADRFGITAWIRAEHGAASDLALLADRLGLPGDGRTDVERASAVWSHLEDQPEPWLVVLDNVEDTAILADIPTGGWGEVLVTTRMRRVRGTIGSELVLDGFDTETATRFLLDASGRKEDGEAAARVAEALGGLPLALALAAAYCEHGGPFDFSAFLRLVEELRVEVLFESSRVEGYDHMLAATFQASIDRAAGWSPLAPGVLATAAFLGPEDLTWDLLGVGRGGAAERKAAADAIQALQRACLLQSSASGLRAHRLLLKYVRDALGAADARAAFSAAVEAVRIARPPSFDDPADWPAWSALVPHVRELARYAPDDALDPAPLLELIGSTVEQLLVAGSPGPARDLAERAVVVATKLGGDGPAVLEARWRRARAELLAGSAVAAVADLEALVAEVRAVFGRVAPATLGVRRDLVFALEAVRRSSEAIDLASQLVTDCQRTLPIGARTTAEAVRGLAGALRSVGRTAEAIDLLEPMVVDAQIGGSGDQQVLQATTLLASCYRAQGRVEEAIRLGEALVGRCEAVLGGSHLLTLQARFDLSSSYRSAGRVQVSIDIERSVVTERTRLLGDRHDDTLWAMNDLAVSYVSAGWTVESVELARRVFALRREIAGAEASPTLTAAANLAIALRGAGRLAEALALQEHLVEVRTRVLGPDHFSTWSGRDHLGVTLRRLGRADEAVAVATEVVAHRVRLLGADHPASLVARDNLGAAQRVVGDLGQAVANGRSALAGEERRLGPNHPECLWARANLGQALHAQGDVAEAGEVLSQARQGAPAILGSDHPFLAWLAAIEASWSDVDAPDPAGSESERILWE
jgi:tetratricopeptide (TPR) repeat protein